MATSSSTDRNRARPDGSLGRFRGLIAGLLALKMLLAVGWLTGGSAALARNSGIAPPSSVEAPGERELHPALEPVPVTIPQPRDNSEARSLLQSLASRQALLEKRERELAAREDRLELYEKDLAEKIGYLENLQKEISRESGDMAQADAEAAASLAKVYAAMKPSEAAPLLDRLDDETVLRILAHMRAKQIGELLPLLDRDKAIVLTQALAAGK